MTGWHERWLDCPTEELVRKTRLGLLSWLPASRDDDVIMVVTVTECPSDKASQSASSLPLPHHYCKKAWACLCMTGRRRYRGKRNEALGFRGQN